MGNSFIKNINKNTLKKYKDKQENRQNIVCSKIPAILRRVIDGDTIEVGIVLAKDTCINVCIRIYGIDTPETRKKRGKSKYEKQAGKLVTEYVKNLYKDYIDGIVYICLYDWGVWGRIIGDIYLPNNKSLKLSDLLIEKKLARVRLDSNKIPNLSDKECLEIISCLDEKPH